MASLYLKAKKGLFYISSSRYTNYDQDDISRCKVFAVKNFGKSASRAYGPQTKVTTITLKGYFGFIIAVGGAAKTLQILSILSYWMLKKLFKKAAREEIADDIFDVVCYESIYGLCKLY